MAYDSARGVTVLFGGYGSSGILNDTWEYVPQWPVYLPVILHTYATGP
jgi:hypothetical protein